MADELIDRRNKVRGWLEFFKVLAKANAGDKEFGTKISILFDKSNNVLTMLSSG